MIPLVDVAADAAAVARDAADAALTVLSSYEPGRSIHIALTGGGVGIATIAALAGRSALGDVGPERLHLWFSDERFVASGSADRNDIQAAEAWGEDFPVPAENIHRVAGAEGGLSASAAAELYWRQWQEQEAEFSLVLLGLGPDAHVASLFPGLPGVLVEEAGMIAVHDSPKPPPTRVSFTMPLICSAERVWIVAAGEAKADAVALALAPGTTPSQAPASAARGRMETHWFIDQAAASKL